MPNRDWGRLKSEAVKQKLISTLVDEGYGTYARRLEEFRFVVADMLTLANGQRSSFIETAAAFTELGTILINPSFLDNNSIQGSDEKMWSQLSVIIRHELLHFLLQHQKRFAELLKKSYPQEAEKYLRSITINKAANYAMDWDLSREGYDEHDKEVVRKMTLNGRVIGGLILEDDHPEWMNKTLEELLEIMINQLKQENKSFNNKKDLTLHKVSHSQDYRDMYNKILKLFDEDTIDENQLNAVLQAAEAGQDIFSLDGSLILKQGD